LVHQSSLINRAFKLVDGSVFGNYEEDQRHLRADMFDEAAYVWQKFMLSNIAS
jgi:hypothetical protein